MGRIFTLSNTVRDIASQAIQDLVDQLGKDCVLVYPPTLVPCPDCATGPVSHPSTNGWVTGGPLPVSQGSICPLCDGSGVKAEQHTETIKMLLAYAPKDFFKPFPAGIQVPDGTIQAKTYLKYATKLLQAREMIVQPSAEGIARWRYVLDGEPADVGNIVQGTFVVSQWKRAG